MVNAGVGNFPSHQGVGCGIDNSDIALKWRLLAYIAASGDWLAHRVDTLGPTILLRELLHRSAKSETVARQASPF